MLKQIIIIMVLLSASTLLIPGVNAGCSACKGEGTDADWARTASSFLDGTPQQITEPILFTAKLARQNYETENAKDADSASSAVADAKVAAAEASDPDATKRIDEAVLQAAPQRGGRFSSALVPISSDLDADIILDISPSATEYIPGAININYESFLGDDKRLKPASEMAKILGDAGISQDDSVIIYGECQPCGGGPSAATYVYWIMKYLGHEDIRLLDGGIDDWVEARNPTETQPSVLPAKTYIPAIKPELLATHEYVKNGGAQIVDARTSDQLSAGTIPEAVNIPYEDVLDDKKIKGEQELQELFAGLDKDTPVVIYTDTGVKATMPWLALALLGYDARLYSWQDWLANSPSLGISLKEVKAEPNPAKTGDVVKITAVFQEKSKHVNADQAVDELAAADILENSTNETVLTIKGCATCGFGSPQGFADISSDTGIVQIGSKGTASSTTDNGFKCTAMITGPAKTNVGKVIMKRISGDEFSGIWNANVAAGEYDVTIVASAGDFTETFTNALEIEVAGSSKYKNLG